MSNCTNQLILDSPNACQYIQENCEGHFSVYNFLELYYCNLNHSLGLIILFSIFFGILIFNFIGAIADSYLAPSIQIVSKKLKLSDTFSGITLLAFAASAPDVITGIVAGGKEEGGTKVVIGGLFGACLFTVTIVLAGCILGMKQIHADKRALRRDIGCLLISVLYFMVLTVIGTITPLLACGFFAIYVLFFVYVIYEERKKVRREKIHEERLLKIEDEDEDIWESDRTANHGKFEPKSAMHIRKRDKDLELVKESKSEGHLDSDDEFSDMEVSTLRIKMKESLRRAPSRKYIEEKAEEDHQIVHPQTTRPHQVLHPSLFKPHHDESGKQSQILEMSPKEAAPPKKHKPQSTVKKIIRIINIPILFIGDLTMPSFEKENWNVYTTALTPVFGSLFVLSELGLIGYLNHHWILWIVFGVSMILLSIFIFIKGHKKNLAAKYPGIFAPITLIVSLFWLNLITSLVVDFLTFIQIVTNLSLYFLSITILAWGNSLEDFFVNYAISRKGFGKVALGGVYGSQIFAILIGFGGGIFRLALKDPIVLNLYQFGEESWRENIMTLFLLVSTIVVLGLTLVVGKLSHWTLAKKTVISVLGFYAVFIVALTLIAFI